MTNAPMQATTATNKGYPVGWLVNSCDWLWRKMVLPVWSVVIVGGAVSAFVTWLANNHSFDSLSKWIQSNLPLVLTISLSLIFLTILIFVIRFIPVGASERAARKKYLAYLIGENAILKLAGIPDSLITSRIG